jgi:hypothetical protein
MVSAAMPTLVRSIVEEIGDRQQRHEAQRGLANGALQHGFRCRGIGRGIARNALRRQCHQPFPCRMKFLVLVKVQDAGARSAHRPSQASAATS